MAKKLAGKMEGNKIKNMQRLDAFIQMLRDDEKSKSTVEKYYRDVRVFLVYVGEVAFTREVCNAYKMHICERYKPASVNSMLSAINRFLTFVGCADLHMKKLKVQRRIFCSRESELDRAEYERLVQAAKRRQNVRLALILETICGTGIRISELKHITVESLRTRNAEIYSKGKVREILIPDSLAKKLAEYCRRQGIKSGSIFITRNGSPINRSNVWKEMKALCKSAGVDSRKVFPHNLRHLFARTYYSMEKDLNRLADLLGHSSIETTRIYTMCSSQNERKKIERLGLVLKECNIM